MDYANNRGKIHFVGIRGIAMASLALYCQQRGFSVTGSDTDGLYPSEEILSEIHVSVLSGFHKEHIQIIKPDLVIYTGAHNGMQNPEVQEAIALGIPVSPHGKALGNFMNGKKQISIAGCHGKTTTSSMLATILASAGSDPSYVIGCGLIRGLGLPGHYGLGEFFIAEADEYVTDPTADHTPRFLWQNPDILIVTNVDYDHPDVYPTFASIKVAYKKLVNKLSKLGTLILNQDDRQSLYLKKMSKNVFSVGESGNAKYRILDKKYTQNKSSFILSRGRDKIEIQLSVSGAHNIQNAAMAAVAAKMLGISWGKIINGLAKFGGAKRRFEFLKSINGVHYYDDYAHHPSEIKATLRAAHEQFPDQRIIAVFQPHTYSRTKVLLKRFAEAFQDADRVILTNIYASAREHETLGITGETLADRVRILNKHTIYAQEADTVARCLKNDVKPGDIVIFMGAGDIFSWEPDILKKLIHN